MLNGEMAFSWDKSDPDVWHGKCPSKTATGALRLIVERLPDGSGWDWTVWEPDGPKVTQHGARLTPREAAVAAEIIAVLWNKVRKDHEMS